MPEEQKKDSCANNDFRHSNYKSLLACKLDTIRIEYLAEKSGKPSEIRNTNHGKDYLYYYFNIRTRPKGHAAPLAAWYIAFYFNVDNKFSTIGFGDIDL